jgi:hypothetical protein
MPMRRRFVRNDVIAVIAFGCGVLLAMVAGVGSSGSGRVPLADSRGLGPMAHFPVFLSLCRSTELHAGIGDLMLHCERKTP